MTRASVKRGRDAQQARLSLLDLDLILLSFDQGTSVLSGQLIPLSSPLPCPFGESCTHEALLSCMPSPSLVVSCSLLLSLFGAGD